MPRVPRFRRGVTPDVGVGVLSRPDRSVPALQGPVRVVTDSERDLAVRVRSVLKNIDGFSEFERRLLASLIARRLHTEGYRK